MKRVLVIDDSTFMRLILKDILTKNGYELVGEGENGVVGVRKYKELMPDIVTMDITMPEMTGIEALKEIKAINPNAKVCMVSAMGQEAFVKEAILSGAKGFIVKPFLEDNVIKILSQL